jgi:predicted O-methyltransferase YrrM
MNYCTDTDFHYEFLELLAKRLRPQLYVELGVAAAKCIERVAPYCHRAIGVDVQAPNAIRGYEFFHGSTVDFFKEFASVLEPVELAFIDADHRHAASLQDFESLLPHVANDGLILLHDTYPENARWLADDHCSDSYRTAEAIYCRSVEYGVEVATLPAPPGLTIVRKRRSPMVWLSGVA